MKDTLSNFIIFAAGAAIGSAVTWKFLKDRYERLVQEDSASLREYYSKRDPEKIKVDQDSETEVDNVESNTHPTPELQPSVREYAAMLAEEGYTDYTNIDKQKKEEADAVKRPYVIAPEEFGECDYDTESLTYYSDGTLTDELDEPIEDVDQKIGKESLTHFGEYEADSVFVRNDELKTDYEILFDTRNYADVVNRNPHRSEE